MKNKITELIEELKDIKEELTLDVMNNKHPSLKSNNFQAAEFGILKKN